MEFPLAFPFALGLLLVAPTFTIYLPLIVGGGVLTGRRQKMDKRSALAVVLATLAVLVIAVVGWWLPQAQAGGLALAQPGGDLRPRLTAGQYSMPWGGTSTGDASLAPYDDDEWSDMQSLFLNYDRTADGVLATNHISFTGLLAVTNSPTTTLTIATGAAVVDGKLYYNSSTNAITTTLIKPAAGLTNYYRVVLRKSWASQTVRATLLGPSTGGYPSLVQTDGTTWDVPIARHSLTSGGVSTTTDDRQFIGAKEDSSTIDRTSGGKLQVKSGGITATQIADSAVTTGKIANRTRYFLVPLEAAYEVTTTTTLHRGANPGVLCDATRTHMFNSGFVVPEDYVSGLTVKTVLIGGTAVVGTDVGSMSIYFAANGEAYTTHSASDATFTGPYVATQYQVGGYSATLTGCAAGDLVSILVSTTSAGSVADTYYWVGFLVEYTADS